MKENRVLAEMYVGDDEGGLRISSSEPGGACKHGVSMEKLTEVWAAQGRGVPTLDDLKALTAGAAGEIYASDYFDKIGFDKFPAGLDYIMANTAIMQGVHGAQNLLAQAKTLVPPDNTLALGLMVLLLQARAKFHDPQVGPHLNTVTGNEEAGCGPGWGDRICGRVPTRAIAMMHTV